jgi:hypothetical protein
VRAGKKVAPDKKTATLRLIKLFRNESNLDTAILLLLKYFLPVGGLKNQ